MNTKCPYCAEEISQEDRICPFCGQYLKYSNNQPGYALMSELSQKIKQLQMELFDIENNLLHNGNSTITTEYKKPINDNNIQSQKINRIDILKKQIKDMEIEKEAFIQTTKPIINDNRNQNPSLLNCPYCHELIKPEAIICRYCRRELSRAKLMKELNYYCSLPGDLGWPSFNLVAPLEIRRIIPDNNDYKEIFINNYKSENNKSYRYYTLKGLILHNCLCSYLFKIDMIDGKPEPYEPLFSDYRSKKMREEYLVSENLNGVTLITNWNFTSLCDIAARFAEQMITDGNKIGYKIEDPCSRAVNLLKKRSQLIKKYYYIIGDEYSLTNLKFYDMLLKDKSFNKEEYEQILINDDNIRDELNKLPPPKGFEKYIYIASELCLHLTEPYLNDILENYRIFYTLHNLTKSPFEQNEQAGKEFMELQYKAASIQAESVLSIIKKEP